MKQEENSKQLKMEIYLNQLLTKVDTQMANNYFKDAIINHHIIES